MSHDLDRLEALFDAAIALPVDERPAFIQASTADQPALGAQLRRLLAAESTAGEFLAQPAAVLGAAWPANFSATTDLAGQTLGAYQIQHRLGEGSGGIVYAAEQTAPVRRPVALKLLHAGLHSREILLRFKAERQTLALMEHSAIARVFDAGTTPDDHPYLAMELVTGEPITRYCDTRKLPLPVRLELFLRVCDAVQHAHQKGVIHRDLKPSNIIVTTHGEPKIIDFGIAKVLASSAQPDLQLTAAIRFLGTPAYMSPEQAGIGTATNIDTRADVYALGVILSELLTGQLPHAPRSLDTLSLEELCRRIREDDPLRPTQLLSALDPDSVDHAAAARALTPPKLYAALAGDIDWIVLRCLDRDRERRYPSAAALAEDLRRHLAFEPVVAAAPSRLYLARKFIRRHRPAVVVASVIALALGATATISTVLALRARRAERAAELAAATRQSVVDFLRKDILQQASPEEQANRQFTVAEALDRAATKLDGRFPDQPVVEAAIRATLGATYSALGRYDVAHKHHQRCYDLRRAALGPDDRLTQQALNNVVISLNDLGRHADAARLAAESVATLTHVYGADDSQTIQTQQTLGSTLIYNADWPGAERVLTDALTHARRIFGPTHADTIVILSNLSTCQIQGGRHQEAEPLLRELLAWREKSLGPDHPRTLYVVQNLSAVYAKLGRLDEASTLAERVYATRERLLGREHPQFFTAAIDLAAIRSQQARSADALSLYRLAHAGRLKVLGPDHPSTHAAATALAEAERAVH